MSQLLIFQQGENWFMSIANVFASRVQFRSYDDMLGFVRVMPTGEEFLQLLIENSVMFTPDVEDAGQFLQQYFGTTNQLFFGEDMVYEVAAVEADEASLLTELEAAGDALVEFLAL